MKQPRCLNRAWIALLLVLTIGRASVGAEAANDQIGRIGRENPFGEILTNLPMPAAATPQPRPVTEEIPELALETVVLKFLDATSLMSALNMMVQPYGTIAVNKANNSVVICDTPAKLEKILTQIKKVDRTPEQLMIEVVVLEVQLQDDTELGVNWDLLTSDRPNAVYRQNFSSSRLRSTIADADTIGDATAFNTVGLGAEFSVISGTVRAVLHVIQQKREVEIVASPSARVVSGQSATIKAVEEIPYQEITDTAAGGAAALTSTQFKEVGVNLLVTAIVADSNNIFLTVDTEQNVRTGQSAAGIPVVDTRRVTTDLVLKDSQVVIIGGLRRQESTKETRQIPLLGDLPLLGGLFRSTDRVTRHSELVVLLSPHIDRGEPLPAPIAAKYDAARGHSLLSEAEMDAARRADDLALVGGRRPARD